MGAAYRAAPRATLIAAELPPFTAVYHRASGITHLLAEPAPQILAALADEAMSVDALRARLSDAFELAGGEALDARLEELVAAGLVSVA